MASNNETTTKFKVDISELKKAMQDAKRQVALANSEFKAVSSSMDDWTKSSEGLTAKLKQLDSNLKSQERVLDEYEKTLEEIKKEYGENSKEAMEWTTKVNNQKAVVNKTQKEIDKFSTALDEVADAEKTAAKTGKDVSEVLDDMGDSAEDAEDGFTVLKGAVATFAGNVMTSLVDSVKNGISSLAGLADETREYRTELGKLETAFTTAGFTTETATETYKELYSVLADEGQSVEAANMLAKLCDTEEDLVKWTNIATGVYGTFGSSLPIESLAEAANETSKTGSLTGALADALNWAGVNEEDFQASLDGCTTEQERQALITKTLNGLYSDAAKQYKKTNKSIIDANKANSDYTDTVAEMGETIEPVTTAAKKGFTGLLKEVLKLVEDVDMTAFSGMVESAFDVLKNDVLPAVKNGFTWIIENKDVIVGALTAITAGFLAFKVTGLITGAVTAVKNLTAGVGLLKAVVTALGGPVSIIITAVSALTAGFIYLWNNCEGFRNFFLNMWETIKNTVGAVVEAVVGFFTGLWETVTAGAQAFWDGIVGIFSTVAEWFDTYVIQPVVGFFTGMWDAISSGAKAVWDVISGIFSPIVEWFKKLFMSIYNTLSDIVHNIIAIVRGLWEIIVAIFTPVAEWFYNNVIKPVTDFFKKLWDGISDGAKKLWEGIKSVFKAVSTWFSNTVIEPVKKVFTGLWDGLKDGAKAAWEGIKSVFSTVATFFKDIFTNAWTAVKNVFSVGGKIFDGIKDGIVTAFKAIVNAIITGINKVVSLPFDGINWALNKIRNIDILGVEPFKWIKTISVPQIPLLAKGGVVSRATQAIIGEDGAEAVMPLENNTGWMRKLAADLVAEMQLGGVTSSSVSNTSGVTYNFYQTNNSPKALSRLEIYRQSKNLLGYAGGV